MADYIDYLRGYATPRDDAAYAGINPEFGRRLMAMLQAAPEHVRRPDLIESLARDNETQARAIRDVAARRGIPFTPMLLARGIPGYAAPVGGSRHQEGYAADFNLSRLPSEGRDWLRSNAGAYGLRFPVPTDPGHLEYDAGWQGTLPNAQPATVSRLPTSFPPVIDSAMLGLSASRSKPETSMPPIMNSAMREFDGGGSVGEFANTKRDADTIDYAVQMEKGIKDNPNSYRGMAAVLGAVDAIPSSGSDMYSRARANYPYTYRAAQAAALAPVVALAPKVGVPWAALSVARDPVVTQYYHDNIAPRGFRDGGAVEAALRIASKQTDPNPSDAAKEAGNYKMGHARAWGLDITIENAKGSERSGIGKDGKRWSVRMPAIYGYVKGTVGKDGDHVDVYVGPDTTSEKVFVVDQINAESRAFDEHKCLLGFKDKADALSTYEKGFSDGKGRDRIGSVSEMGVTDFKQWLKDGNTKKPVGDLKRNFANGGTVMPHKNVQAIQTALDVARRTTKRADGGPVEGDGGGWLDRARGMLRSRAVNGPDAEQMLSQVMMLPVGGPSASRVASGMFQPRSNATFDQTTLAPALRAAYTHGTPAEQAEVMRIWGSLHRPAGDAAQAAVRTNAPDVAAQAQRDYYTRMAAEATGHAPRGPNPAPARGEVRPTSEPPPPMHDRGRAMREFETMQPPPRAEMHAYGGRVGYAEGGDVDPLVPGGLPPLPSEVDPVATMDWTPETERRRAFGPPAPVARSANTAMGDILAQYFGNVDVGRNVSGLERGAGDVLDTAYQFTGVPLAAEAGRHMSDAVETGDVLRGLGAAGEMGIAALPASRVLRNAVTSSGLLGRIGTGATMGGAPLLAAGALSTDVNAQGPAQAALTGLLEQRASTQQQAEEARRRRETFRPKGGKRPTPQDDPQYTEADAEYRRLANTLEALDKQIGIETKKNSPEELARARRIQAGETERERQVAEAVAARDRVRRDAPKPFNESFPWLAPFMPALPIALGATTGAMMGRSRLRGENANLNQWNTALDRATSTTSPRVRGEMIDTAQNINEAWRKPNLLDKAMTYAGPGIVGGIEGALATGLPPAYNSIMLPTTNPERTALQEYYRRLPEDHPDRARTLAMLENETALPQQNPPAVEAREYFTNWRQNALPRMAAGAFEGAAATLPGTTVTNMLRPHEMALPRARTNAMVANRPPRETPALRDTLRAPTELPMPLPALPAPAPALAPPTGLPGATPLPSARTPTSTFASESPPHHSHLQPREAGRFAGPPKKPRKPRTPTRDRDIENDPDHDPNTRNLTGRKSGGLVNAALEIARRYMGGRVGYQHGGSVAVGPILGTTGGREDAKPVDVESGSYVLPADFVSSCGTGNTMAGHQMIEQVFGKSDPARATGGPVAIKISDGEHVLTREQVERTGGGDYAQGCRILDALVKKRRAETIKTLKGLPGPAKG